MTLRREVVLGGLLTILTASSEACCQPLSAAPRLHGCIIPEDLAPQFFARGSGHQTYEKGDEPLPGGSGDRDFDVALAHALVKIGATLQVLPGFAYYDDGERANANATTSKRLQRADGTVLLGKRMLDETRVELEHPEVALTAVCAHEFGHILQFKYGLHKTLLKGQATKKRVELHADFLAGYFAGVRRLENDAFPAVIFPVKLRSMGDNNFNQLEHHGAPDERAEAAVQGFKVAYYERRKLVDAVRSGVQYVSSL